MSINVSGVELEKVAVLSEKWNRVMWLVRTTGLLQFRCTASPQSPAMHEWNTQSEKGFGNAGDDISLRLA